MRGNNGSFCHLLLQWYPFSNHQKSLSTKLCQAVIYGYSIGNNTFSLKEKDFFFFIGQDVNVCVYSPLLSL